MKIMIDMDDVLTNFNVAFLEVANEMYGTPVDTTITVWDFWKCVPGLTLEMEEKVWERIKSTKNFYESLPAYASPRDLKRLADLLDEGIHEFYFITSRFPTKGRSVQAQSQRWLEKHLGRSGAVIVSSNKGQLCQILGIEYAVDDAPHHIENLLNHGINTYIIDWPYNRHIEHRFRVKTLGDFLDSII
ncbi:MAG: hypothetical protein DRP32_08640 [Thermotogae bacterium]|nr:hypothetical protein [Kosmotoga sp.]RKX47624.1 MAG: hypothetical protein DRP32_08640 [Thermotogota bacterium]